MGRAEDKYQSSRLDAKFDHLRVKHSKSLKERGMSTSNHKPKWREKYPASIYDEMDDPIAFEELLREIDREREMEEVMVIGDVRVNKMRNQSLDFILVLGY